LLAVLVVACASLAHAESEVDVAATLSARWGHWTLERLRWKREEIKSDLGQTHAEKARVKVWGNKVCQLVREIGQKSVLAAKESVSEWTDILKIRRDQRGYHVGRQGGYDRRHNYITNGPLGRRNSKDKAAWCKANQEACDRWHHEKHLYFKHHFQALKDKHGQVTAHSRKRVANAKANLQKAVDALAAARKHRATRNTNCANTFEAARKHWKARIVFLNTRLTAVNNAIKHVKDVRVKREASYKPFYMTKCRYIGGKHHMYYCYLDTNNASKAHHRFRVCHHRGPRVTDVGKLKFRCYK